MWDRKISYLNLAATLHICAVTPSGLASLQFRRQASRSFSAWRCGQEEKGRKKRMKHKSLLAPFIIFQLVLLWVSPAAAVAQPLASRSTTAASYARRGAAWAAKGEYERASADFTYALQLKPHDSWTRAERCGARVLLGDPGTAISDCDQALELAPRIARDWSHRGLARCIKGDFAGAIADFDRAIKLDPGRAEFYR